MTSSLSGVHHIAFVTERPEETITLYRDVLGLPLVHTVSATGWISDGFPDFIHFFFELGRGAHLAFFYFFDTERPPVTHDLEQRARHIAFDVGTEAELMQWRDRLKSAGVPVSKPIAHELVESIYFEDPNGIQLEVCRPLRAFGPVDAEDAQLTLEALLKVVQTGHPTLHEVWRAKADLLQDRLTGKES